jgi:hypothetical protein
MSETLIAAFTRTDRENALFTIAEACIDVLADQPG